MKRNFKHLCLVIFIAIIISLFCMTVSAANSDVVLGDMNGDSVVNIDDAIYLLKYTMLPSRYPISQSADVNGTGDVNIDDAIYLLKHTMLPSRYPITNPCIPATAVVENKIDSTCKEEGSYDEVVYCSVCGKELNRTRKSIAKKDAHIEGTWIVDKEPTAGENGKKHIECTVCGIKLKEEIIPATGSVGLDYSINQDGTSCTIVGIGTCNDSVICIPTAIDGYAVTSIGYRAFFDCDDLISIIIPQGVTIVGEQAFYRCFYLDNITISDTVKSIGSEAFRDCISLSSVKIGSGVTKIGEKAFYECEMLNSITFSEDSKLKEIGSYAFYNCVSIASIKIPDSVTNIGSFALGGCSGLLEITLPFTGASPDAAGWRSHFGYIFGYSIEKSPESWCPSFYDNTYYYIMNKTPARLENVTVTTKIGEYGFNYCNLDKLTILDSVSSIGDYALNDCLWSNSYYNVYDNAYYLGNDDNPYLVFVKPKETTIKLFNINDATKFIYSYAFQNCTSLMKLTIPDNVKQIGYRAFQNCESLINVKIPSSVQNISKEVFNGCYSLESITLPFMSYRLEDYFYDEGVIEIDVPADVPASLKSVAITGGKKIPDYAFYNCRNIIEITVSNSITTFGQSCFKACYNLEKINYCGSEEQWQKINTGLYWDESAGSNTTNRKYYVVYYYNSSRIMLNSCNSVIETAVVTVNTPYKLTVPTRSGYSFVGWFDAEENGTQYTDGEGVSLNVWSGDDNKTLYAHWNLNYYTITYDCDENVDLSGMPTHYTVEDEDLPLSKQYKNHQTVTWKLDDETVASIDTSMAKNIMLKGVWTSAARSPVSENQVEATTCIDGHYDSVVYCECCGKELSREKITILAPHNLKNGICTLCNYENLTFNLKFTSNGDNTCYVSGVRSRTDTEIYIPKVSPTGEIVTGIGEEAFSYCRSLTYIEIPDSVTSIENHAFWSCESLTNIIIPNSVTNIGTQAFGDCRSLTSITIPASVTSIKISAFDFCYDLTSIKFNGTVAQWKQATSSEATSYFFPTNEVVCSNGKVSYK